MAPKTRAMTVASICVRGQMSREEVRALKSILRMCLQSSKRRFLGVLSLNGQEAHLVAADDESGAPDHAARKLRGSFGRVAGGSQGTRRRCVRGDDSEQ